MFLFCVGLRCVECQSGTIYLSASGGWVAGLYRFFSLVLFVSLVFYKLLILF